VTTWTEARDDVRRLCTTGGPDRALRSSVLQALRSVVPFDHYVWMVTDPVTSVGASPLAEIPSLAHLSRVVRLKYLTEVNRWTGLPADHVATLVAAPDGAAEASRSWQAVLSGYGVRDVASAVLRDRFGIWGFIDLWRSGAGPAVFTPEEAEFVASLLPELTAAARSTVAATFRPSGGVAGAGPVVLTLSDELVPQVQTPQTDAQLRALLPTRPERPPVPAVAINVAAQLLAVEAGIDHHPPTAMLAHGPGLWITVRAARLGPTPTDHRSSIAVTVERSTPTERAEVYARAFGLTARETQLLKYLISGADTRALARELSIAEHTVNDHLKSIFAKSGTHSRRQVVANVTG
jgi:DNA-binding CsgD family transcriptional regulator